MRRKKEKTTTTEGSRETENHRKPSDACEIESSKKKKEWSSLVAQMVKNLPAMQETRIQSLDGEDPLEKRMATHSSIFA